MLRAVLDTNVLVSAAIADGAARALLQKGIDKQFRKKFDKKSLENSSLF